MSNFLTRMIDEKKQLSEKREKLLAFIHDGQPNFMDNQDWDLLQDQYNHMNSYLYILSKRIDKALDKQAGASHENKGEI